MTEPVALTDLGLEPGMRARFRRRDGERWRPARVVGLERDGSLGLRDEKGAARAIPVELVEVATTGPRGGATWEPVAARAERLSQLGLF